MTACANKSKRKKRKVWDNHGGGRRGGEMGERTESTEKRWRDGSRPSVMPAMSNLLIEVIWKING